MKYHSIGMKKTYGAELKAYKQTHTSSTKWSLTKMPGMCAGKETIFSIHSAEIIGMQAESCTKNAHYVQKQS